MSGQTEQRAGITNITNADPCVVTIDADISLSTGSFVRLTDLNGSMPVPRGEDPINNKRFRVVLNSATEFKIQDPITHEYIDSTNYTPYVVGGSCNYIQKDFNYSGS
jgi:hypothetical protein